MVNNYAKMRRVQRQGIKLLEEDGCIVHLNPHTRFNKDMFKDRNGNGLWDAIAITKQHKVVWIQFKTGYVSKKERYFEWCDKHKQMCLLMQYKGNKKWLNIKYP